MLVLTFVVIVLGAYTRLKDAGLGCPDWPGCYGRLVVPNTAEQIDRAQDAYPAAPFDRQKAWIEMIHRLAAGGLGLLIFITTLIDWLRARRVGESMSRLLPLLCLLVVMQGAFGVLTVTWKLLPLVVVIHLFGAFFILALVYIHYLVLTADFTHYRQDATSPFVLRLAVAMGMALVLVQVLLGGWTASNYAGQACTDFPLCNGHWFPPQMDFSGGFNFWQPLGPNYEGGQLPAEARVAIHFFHRMFSIVLLAYWVVFYLVIRRIVWLRSSLLPTMHMILGLLLLQMVLGIMNVLGGLPLSIALAHNGLAAILLLAVVRLLFLVLFLPFNRPGVLPPFVS